MARCGKLALLLGTMAFQLQAITIFITNQTFGNTITSNGQAVLAMNIIAFLALLVAEILLAEVHLVGVRFCGTFLDIMAMILLFGGGACILIAIAIFGSDSSTNAFNATYPFTTFCTAIAASIIAGIFVLLDACCNC